MSINKTGLVSRRHWFLFVVTVLVFQSLTSQVMAATLEELERKIEQQKRNQKRANAVKPAGSVNAPGATREATPSSKLVIEADAACELKINGVRMRTLQANSAESFPVELGQQLLECTSTQVPAIKVKSTWTVARAGSQEVVSFRLRSSMAAFQLIELVSGGIYNNQEQEDSDWDSGRCTSQEITRREMTTGSPDSTGRVKGSISISYQEILKRNAASGGCDRDPQTVTRRSIDIFPDGSNLRFESEVTDHRCVANCSEFKQDIGSRDYGSVEVIDGGRILKIAYSSGSVFTYSRR